MQVQRKGLIKHFDQKALTMLNQLVHGNIFIVSQLENMYGSNTCPKGDISMGKQLAFVQPSFIAHRPSSVLISINRLFLQHNRTE